MVQQFYEPVEEFKVYKPCDALREDLKFCLVNTDCVKKVG